MSEGQEKPAQPSMSTKDDDNDDKAVDTPIGCLRCRKDECRKCCCSVNNYWKTVFWMTIVTFYLFLGGLFFSLAERPAEIERANEAAEATLALVEARDEFIRTVVNTTNLTEEEALEFLNGFVNASERLNEALEATEVGQIWDFASAVFFCVTVITTIGYGTIAPATGAGQTLFIFYAIIGIPLALTFLGIIGNIMTDYLDAALRPLLSRSRGKRNPVLVRGIGVLVFLSLALIFMIFIPSAIFYATEDWTYGQSIYFCFVTLTTVGFGDFVPAIAGASTGTSLFRIYKLMVSVWLWIGLAFVAAIISEVTNFIEAVTKKLGQSRCCNRKGGADIVPDTEKQELHKLSPPPESPTTPTPTTAADSADTQTTD